MDMDLISEGDMKNNAPEFLYGPGGFPTGGDGMSLRDWFAGMAMVGIIDASNVAFQAEVAGFAYRMADAMLAKRGKK
jgi:hypothetical protein